MKITRPKYFGLLGFAGALLAASAGAQEEGVATAPVPPPSAPPQRSAAELEKLVAPIALYPDTLLAVMLPAAAYPLDIVMAAQYLADHGSTAKVDDQPWDVNVKAVAGVPTALAKMEKDLTWTLELGQAFIEQPLDVMDAIQRLRAEAKAAGKLKTTPEQVVTVGDVTVDRQYEGETIYVTNSVITIEPAKPEVIYVPVYDPVKTYEAPPPKEEDDDDDAEAFVTFAAAVTLGAIIANNCDWCYGGVVVGGGGVIIVGGGGHPPYYPPPIYWRPPPYYPPPGYRPHPPGYRPPGYRPHSSTGTRPSAGNTPGGAPTAGQHWQPDQGRLGSSGGPGAQPSASTREARGWGEGATPSRQPAASSRDTGAAARPAPAAPTATASSAGRSSSSSGAFGDVSSGSRDRDSSRRGAASRGGGGRGGGGRGGGRR